MTTYTATRARGMAEWSPRPATLVLLEQVKEVIQEYRAHLPITIRQIFYRLVGTRGYTKDELAYARLCEHLNRARRAGLIGFSSIRDDNSGGAHPWGYDSPSDFWETVKTSAENYARDKQEDQAQVVEMWVEAEGMVPQVQRVARRYGIPVVSSGGFDSTTTKHNAARRMLRRDVPTTVIHIGDLDPSGVSMFDSAAEDVIQFFNDLGSYDQPCEPTFVRAVVTREQVEQYSLPEAPAKSTDRRGDWQGGTVQAEALNPADLANEIRYAIEEWVDDDVLNEIKRQEEEEKAEIMEQVEQWID